MAIYMFPGQGSQYKGMGKELFNDFPLLVSEAKMILGYDIQDLCLEDKDERLNQTQYTQPALYIVNALTYYKKLKESKKEIAYVIGHSLGEYNALLAAEVFDFTTGLRLVKKRGELMAQANEGGMDAVIGLKIGNIKAIMHEAGLTALNIANYNSYTQIVVSGPKVELNEARILFEQTGGTVIPLKVSGAFHSHMMMQAKETFIKFLDRFNFNPPKIPVLANVDAKAYGKVDIATRLADQITSSVCWTDTVQYLLDQGNSEFLEIGPGNVLTKLVERIRNKN